MKTLTLLFALTLVFTACSSGPTNEQVEATVNARLTAVAPTVTNTPQPTATRAPATPTPKPTNTPKPSPTFTNTPEPLGLFTHPAPVSTTLSVSTSHGKEQLGCTVLEVRRGAEAAKLAKTHLEHWYEDPIQDQEYLAVHVRIDVITAPPNEVYSLYLYWHLTLRYEDGGRDIWSIYQPVDSFEGYPPLSGDGWLFYLVRKGGRPLLYFQPDLTIAQEFGDRTSGVYFALTEQ